MTIPDEPPAGTRGSAPWLWVGLGLGTATCATMLFEIVLTRIFSVILFYHYGFVVISMAMLGIGSSGILVYLYPERFSRERVPVLAALACLAFAVSIVVSLLLFHGLVSLRTTWPLRPLELLLVFVMMIPPFFLAGLCAVLPLSRYTERVGILYAVDLLGAAIGAGLVIPLLTLLGGHRVLIASASLAAIASICFALGAKSRRTLTAGVVVTVACLVGLGLSSWMETFTIRFSKLGEEQDVIYEKWNSFSRVTVRDNPRERLGWNMSLKAPPVRVRHRGIRIDGGAGTPMLEFDGNFDRMKHLRYDVSSLGYQVRPVDNVLIIGAGGGRDILTARSVGVERIHAVEINPIIVDIVRNRFRSFSHSPYDLPGVTHSVTDGRNYLSTSTERFDLIQLSAVDTIAASASGALALVEQSLYTVEAFLEYYDHLGEDGLVAITRPFSFRSKALDVTLRTVDLVREAWLLRGVPRAERHLFVIGRRKDQEGGIWGTLLASRRPFTDTEVAELRSLCAELGFGILYAPGAPDNLNEIDVLLSDSRDGFLDARPTNVRATTDDRPFFFYFQKPFWFREAGSLFQRSEWERPRASLAPTILTWLFLGVLALTVITAYLLPMALGRLKLVAAKGAGAGLVYFAGIGLGFIMVEIALLQRYTLLLGQPLYAFSVILGTMLVLGGAGSLLSHRVGNERPHAACRLLLAAVVGGVLLHAVAMPRVLDAAMHWSLSLRLTLTILTIAPLALAMGTGFPLGMRLLERRSPAALPWAWCVNGSLSVLGTVIAMVVSIFFGITTTLYVSAAAYLVSVLAAPGPRTPAA